MQHEFGVNQALVEELYLRYLENPGAVGPTWRAYFEALPLEDQPTLVGVPAPRMVTPIPEERRAPGARALPTTPPDAPSTPTTPPAAPSITASAPTSEASASRARNASATSSQAVGAALVTAEPTSAPSPPAKRNGNGHGRTRSMTLPVEQVFARSERPPGTAGADEMQGRVAALINAYRVRGHIFAKLDPLGLVKAPEHELSLERFGLADIDGTTVFATNDLAGPAQLPLVEIVRRLEETYCRSIGVEYTHIEDGEARRWLRVRMESSQNRLALSREEQILLLTKLTDAEIFEQFLHTNFVGAKRFSCEGAESVIPMLELVVERSGRLGVGEIVIAMAHRGRLAVLANVLAKNVRDIFAKFDDHHPELSLGRGDVKYHLGYSSDRIVSTGEKVHLSLAFNPSHLEWVNPVVEGRSRAKQDRRNDVDRSHVLPLVIHGDAAFAGQGVVAETLNLSKLPGYATGGTLHIVINNQIGFTTSPEDGRSTRYCTDITRMLRCPVFHVNGEDPEAVAQVVGLATEYRQRFHEDVVIDMYCYRRYGHNETDEPRFTQPVMYAAIDAHPSVREVYVKHLVAMGQITEEQAKDIAVRQAKLLEAALVEARQANRVPSSDAMGGVWQGFKGGPDAGVPDVPTGVPVEKLQQLLRELTTLPLDFEPNKGVKRTVLDKRRAWADGKSPIDWGAAEHLAFASLLEEGRPIRVTGQDCRRGTFSHRHAVLFDARDGKQFTPLAAVARRCGGRFEIVDSPLSEAGVVGFEYGYSLDFPDALVVWEAQFGDFANCAQVIIDQFISSSEDKWDRLSGLVLLLPHGFEGQGPEHSSARLERFLDLAAEDNIQVCNLTTPANIFHALRRQVLRPWRKPLVVMSPKSLLRAKTFSTLEELASGNFQRIIPDASGSAASGVRRVLLCSGKVYFDLAEAREKKAIHDVHVVRLEQLYPIRPAELLHVLAPYKDGTELVWVQEEPFNSGPWYFMHARLPRLLTGRNLPLRCVSRPESASPATGSASSHALEQKQLVEEAFSAT